MEIVEKIIVNVLTALYQPFWFSILLSILFMFLLQRIRDIGLKETLRRWFSEFKENVQFRKTFLFVFIVTMILFRTLLNRNMWANPVSNVLGNWSMWNEKGELTTEPIENVLLFIPFTFFIYWVMSESRGERISLGKYLIKSFLYSFAFSISIEMLQLFLRLGTFQVSDLFYNTLGGIIGGVLYWLYEKLLKSNRYVIRSREKE